MDRNTDDVIRADMIRLIPEIRSFAKRFSNNPNDVNDLVQETLLRGLANLDKFEPGTRLRSWLFTILRNLFCTRYQQSVREAPGLEDCVSLHLSVPPAQEWAIRMHEFNRAVATLSPEHRGAFNAVLVDGESYEAAAKRCGCPVGTIKSRVNRARLALTQQMGGAT